MPSTTFCNYRVMHFHVKKKILAFVGTASNVNDIIDFENKACIERHAEFISLKYSRQIFFSHIFQVSFIFIFSINVLFHS